MLKFIESEKLKKWIMLLSKIGLIILIFLTIFILNYSQVLGPDDYNYTYVVGGAPGDRIDSLSDSIYAAKFLYKNWTGRVLPHAAIGFFRNINGHIFEFANTAIFILYIIYMNKVLNKKVTFIGIISAFCYLTYSKMFGEKFSWISGALNYLWPATMMTIFIFIVYRYINGEIKLNIYQKIATVLFTFLTGFVHEAISMVGGAFLVILYLYNIKKIWKESKKEKAFYIIVFLVFCLGAFLTIFAPGNMARKNNDGSAVFLVIFDNYKKNIYPIIAVIISMIAIGIMKEKKLLIDEIVCFILPALIATFPMGIIGYFPERAFLPYETMFIIVLTKNAAKISEKIYSKEKRGIALAIVSCGLVLFTYARFGPSTLAQIRYIIPYKYETIAFLENAQANNEKNVLVPKFEYGQWSHFEDGINIHNFFIEFVSGMPINVYTSQYYGFDSVKSIDKDNYLVRIYRNQDYLEEYALIDKTTGVWQNIMQYKDCMEYEIPKEQLKNFVIDSKNKNLKNEIIDFEIEYIGGKLDTSNLTIDDLIIY